MYKKGIIINYRSERKKQQNEQKNKIMKASKWLSKNGESEGAFEEGGFGASVGEVLGRCRFNG